MSDDRKFKMRRGEEEDFIRWATLGTATPTELPAVIRIDGTQHRGLLSQPSARFTSDFTPPDYLIDGLLQRRFIYSLTAPTGAGKTAVALLIAAYVALAMLIGGRRTTAGRVLYFAGENPDDVRMRWIAMAEHLGFDIKNITVRFIPGAYKLAELAARIKQEVELLGGAELIIVDTSAAFFGGADENSNVEMGNYARSLRALTTLEGGPTVLVLCHPIKNAAADNLAPRGGGAFVNEMDGNLVCIKNDMLVTVSTQVKFRGVDFDPIPFELELVRAEALRDSEGRLIPTIIAKPVDEKRQTAIEAKSRSDEDAVLIAMDKHEGISFAAIAENLGLSKSKVQRVIKRLEKHKLVAKERDGYVLTEKGKKTAKTTAYNRDTAGAKYG
jgi:uncharacterized membrane protein